MTVPLMEMPRVRVTFEEGRRKVRAGRAGPVSADTAKHIARLDRPDNRFPSGWRFVALADGGWAVSRGDPDGITWRIGGPGPLFGDVHPAWLWANDAWFDRRSEAMTSPSPPSSLKLRAVLTRAAPTGGSYRDTVHLLAGAIVSVRARRPVVVVVPTQVLLGANHPTRWFATAVLGAMPLAYAMQLTVGTREPAPHPEAFDLVVSDQPMAGFDIVTTDRPGDLQSDPVASFILDRLLQDDADAVENAAARAASGSSDDPWLEAISGYDADPPISVELEFEEEPARRRSPVRRPTQDPTQRLLDVGAWRTLAERPTAERARAVENWLLRVDVSLVQLPVLQAVATTRPPGVATQAWCRVLLDWFRSASADDREVVFQMVERSLLQSEVDDPMRAACWTSAIRAWAEVGAPERAALCFSSDVAARIARSGASRALTFPWIGLAPAGRTATSLDRIVDLATDADDGDRAIVQLHQALRADSVELDHRLLSRWASICARNGRPPPAEFRELLSGPEREVWARGAITGDLSPDRIVALIGPIASGPGATAVWKAAEDRWATSAKAKAHDRLLWLLATASAGGEGAEAVARDRLVEVLGAASFPDPKLASAAAGAAELPNASSVWMWTAITAAEPGQFDEATVDATVVAFCEDPPVGRTARRGAALCAFNLGKASRWEPLDHARWLVRMTLAPQGSGMARELSREIMRGMSSRPDGPSWVAAIVNAMVGLPKDHASLAAFHEYVLQAAWPEGAPDAVVDHLRLDRVDANIRRAVLSALRL
jgi:hypothetical protein